MKINSGLSRRTVLGGASLAIISLFNTSAFAVVDDVKVGVILPMTGATATFGQESFNGLSLALELETGKPTLKLMLEDTQGTPSGSANAINKLLTSDKVSVVMGEVASSNTIAASGAAQTAKVPLMTHASTNDTITIGKDFISRICFVDSFQGKVMAQFAKETLKAKTAIIVVDSDSDYSRGLKDSFTKAFTAEGGQIVQEVSYSQKDTDFKSQLTKVKKAKPDVVFIPGYYTQVGALLRQANELKIKAKFLGTDGWDSPDLFKVAGKASAGHYVSSHFAPDDTDPKVQEFVTGYKKKFNATPGAMAALGYDAGKFLKSAIKVADSGEPTKIKDAINNFKGFEGITGKITLDSNRNAIKPAVILETSETGFKFHSRVNP